MWRVLRTEGFSGLWRKIAGLTNQQSLNNQELYERWLKKNLLSDKDKENIKREIGQFKYEPLISVIVPVYNTDRVWLEKCIESVRNQLYVNWELCIADDASCKHHVRSVLEEYKALDQRINVVYRTSNGHIAAASNSALEIARGEYVALLDHDDEISPDALFEVVKLLNNSPEADMVYSDEDIISEDGKRHTPFFKPGWSPDTFLCQMYTCHLGVYRLKLVKGLGGFRQGFDGSQDYDLVLRLTEKTKNIFHIPKILYHWRSIAGSTALSAGEKKYAHDAAEKALCEALERRKSGAIVKRCKKYDGVFSVNYFLKNKPKISIIIPTKDNSYILEKCLLSIRNNTDYNNYEVIIIDNGSKKKETFDLFGRWQAEEGNLVSIHRLDIVFNYSILNNYAASISDGDLLLLLNDDTEIITKKWLQLMAGQALRDNIGAVGAKLFYPDNTIQHAGIILGVGGSAGHSHKNFQKNDPGYFKRLLINSNYAAVTGACLMVKRELFLEMGGLDESLPVAFNDLDFCLKLIQKGLYNIVLPDVQLYHYESKTRGLEDTLEKVDKYLKSIEIIKERWGDLLLNDPFYNPNLTLEIEDFSIKV